jgi:decaprenylphospho-beta-D-erythro-pentofuranosid-2-ulose 2-reductase
MVGATSAIATEMCRLLAARGARLYLLGGRSEQKLQLLSQQLGPQCVATQAVDFDNLGNDPGYVEQAIQALGGLDWVIVATGYLGDQLATERSFEQAEAVLRTNLLGVVSILIPVANYFEEHGGGQIAVMSSVAGERGRPRNYTYASAKAALNVYLQGLRSRLWSKGTKIHVFKLGPVDTPMTLDHPKNALFSRPEKVAARMLEHIEAGTEVAFVPGFWRPIMAVVRHLPEALFQRVKGLSGR